MGTGSGKHFCQVALHWHESCLIDFQLIFQLMPKGGRRRHFARKQTMRRVRAALRNAANALLTSHLGSHLPSRFEEPRQGLKGPLGGGSK